MKQKYTIIRDDEKNVLVIREYAELDKENLSLLCEQVYPGDEIQTELGKSRDHLLSNLRTHNLYPPIMYAERITDAVIGLYSSGGADPVELVFNDIEFLAREHAEPDFIEEIEEEPSDIDELLEEDLENEFDDSPINPINTSIKIADDDSLDIEDDG